MQTGWAWLLTVPYLTAVHSGVEIESGVQHPNQYFQESRKALGLGVHAIGGGGGAGGGEKEPVTPGPPGALGAPASAGRVAPSISPP
jgi:hypothetical protein